MNDGKVKEFDAPQKLINKPTSHFVKLVADMTREEDERKKKREKMKRKPRRNSRKK